MLKVLIAEKLAPKAQEVLEGHGFQADVKVGMSREELLETIKDYDAILIRSATQVDRELIAAAPKLKVVGRAGVGVDNVDIQAATERGIIVCNAPTSNVVSAAEHTIALMLAVARNIPQANESTQAGKWERSKFQGSELYEKTLAIFGLGRIGGLVAERAKGFGMRLIGYDPYASDERAEAIGVEKFDTIEEILPQADFITVHLPKTKETIGMFGSDEIAQMKDGVILVNAARGGIYQEQALRDGLDSGKLGGVALDVYTKEPADDCPLRGAEKAVLVPHLGASTKEAQERAGVQIAEFVSLGLLDQVVPTAVNVSQLSPDHMEVMKPYIEASRVAGTMIAQIFGGEVGSLEVVSRGQIAVYDPHILATATLRGIFEQVADYPVNLVNADYIAEQHGVKVEYTSEKNAGDYISTVSYKAKVGARTLEMTITLNSVTGEARVVYLMGYKIDLTIVEHMIIMRYADKPGMLGKIGTILGSFDVDIRHLDVASKKDADKALVAMAVDKDVPQEAKERLEKEVVEEAYYISL